MSTIRGRDGTEVEEHAMSDYMFMLENHLSSEQNQVVGAVQEEAARQNLNVFLTGGAMRDMLGGFQVRDLDFGVEGPALKFAKAVADRAGARIVSIDDNRKVAEMIFRSGVTGQIAMSRTERFARTAAKPQVTPATIQEYLRGRDFSINAIALSLNRASRGLLLDPTNGLADLEHKELRTLNTYTFYDEPVRLLRLVRFRIRLGFAVEERTRMQFENARQAELENYIPARALGEELKHIAEEPNAPEILQALLEENLLKIFSPALAAGKLNLPGLHKLEKSFRLAAEGNGLRAERLGPFLFVLAEKLNAKERSALIKAVEFRKPEVDLWQKLEARARKLEGALKAARIKKPSQVYQIVSKAPGDEVVFLLYHSQNKLVQERIRNYIQKYIPLAQEFPAAELQSIPAKPGTPKFEKAREALLLAHLDRRPRKPAPLPPPPPPVEPVGMRGRPRQLS
jgi:tRNA nucleotidyltransferase/poly(A) polymerase